ncbi:MAG TPA: tRNA uridine-5-carboxymethylaminomethyl(34) synthesis GTPase MnmE [Vicinamibacterales bacterium]|nr:tRNA uridine-5-carboxymethylaminomethyl(34) synthesis GTPase MnmE [Vicinamibacterales bacterium]
MDLSPDRTIVALATPPGRGGLAVVRLSGPEAFRIATSLLDAPVALEPRRAVVASVVGAGQPGTIDQAVVLPFAGPASYTGEDVVEISLHGSMTIAAQVIEAAVGAGARMAGPGEFTLRAFLNGRLDLAQAEAVRDLVDASTPLQARVAFDQLTGLLSGRIAAIEQELFALAARIEASIDFPDEGYRFMEGDEARLVIERTISTVEGLLASARRGRLIRDGATVTIVGRPNVGKSSLFNRLVGTERAIVHHRPGTTRDLVTESIAFEGIRLTVVDTAGIRASGDVVERQGVERAERARAAADLVILVLDASTPLTTEDSSLLAGGPSLVVANKVDLPAAWDPADVPGVVSVSTRTGLGLEDLSRAITLTLGVGSPVVKGIPAGGRRGTVAPARTDRGEGAVVGEAVDNVAARREEALVTNIRHVSLLEEARDALRSARTLLLETPGAPEELLAADIQRAREALEQVTGKRTTDDLLREIFSSFCVGK